MKTDREHLYKSGDRILDSFCSKSSTWLDYIKLWTQLNQFEIFVSSLVHEKNIENCTVQEDNSVKRNNVNR